ncbi:DUF5675 family protein, partial [Streptococcus pseudopneumoniae]|uniref:DUF5675 family protein n=1 Tax=Streptococcus pseudopneumoniae TaxID=257758 RepID=UPI0019D698EA
MKTCRLRRIESGEEGTFGLFECEEGPTFQSVELPWKDNAARISCIPPGTYLCEWAHSVAHGECYWLRDVPGREAIQIHVANWG